ncbi:MAG: two pore domain potassium channel family protein [Chloroflexi bacterium]|nr:two pore domain potassium channel family protein [Chloroflexota bacterium]
MLSNIRAQIVSASFALIMVIIMGTVTYRYFEGWTWIQCFYFSVSTFTTTGYGDLHPTSDACRLFTAFYILIGAAIALTSLSIIGTSYLKRREDRIVERRKKRGKLP